MILIRNKIRHENTKNVQNNQKDPISSVFNKKSTTNNIYSQETNPYFAK